MTGLVTAVRRWAPTVSAVLLSGVLGWQAVSGAQVAAGPAADGGGTGGADVAVAEPPPVGHVVIVGSAGLRWRHVNPTDTPHLWRLVGRAAVGSMVVRSVREHSCPGDGWLTLGAGNRARLSPEPGPGCPASLPQVGTAPGGGAVVADQQRVLNDNQRLTHRARPGALAELVECTLAVGPGAAVAAARPGVGRVDRYLERLPKHPTAALSECPLSIVDAGTISDAGRRESLRRADAILGRVLRARPAGSLLMVAGVADVASSPEPAAEEVRASGRLQLAAVAGPGVGRGSIGSWRPGYARLIDVAPTAVQALGLPRSRWFAGVPAPIMPGQPGGPGTRDVVDTLVDQDLAASQQPRQAPRFEVVLVVVQVCLALAAVPLLWRTGGWGGAEGPETPRWRVRRQVFEVAAVAAGLVLPAGLLANAVPWWRSGAPGLTLLAAVLVILSGLTAAIRLGPWWRAPLGPVVAVSAVAAGCYGFDVLAGGRLQLDAVAGYGTADGGRFAGLSPVGAGVLTVGVLLAAGCLVRGWPARSVVWTTVAVGGAGVLLAGVVGMDPGTAVGLAAGVALAAAVGTGSWLRGSWLWWAFGAWFLVTVGFLLLSLTPSAPHRGRLGRFMGDVAEGVPGAVVRRTAEANVTNVATSPFTVLLVVAGVLVAVVLLRPSGGLLRVSGLYPTVRAALLGALLAAVLGGLADGAVALVLGAAVAVALPMVLLLCLRTLARARLGAATAPADNGG